MTARQASLLLSRPRSALQATLLHVAQQDILSSTNINLTIGSESDDHNMNGPYILLYNLVLGVATSVYDGDSGLHLSDLTYTAVEPDTDTDDIIRPVPARMRLSKTSEGLIWRRTRRISKPRNDSWRADNANF